MLNLKRLRTNVLQVSVIGLCGTLLSSGYTAYGSTLVAQAQKAPYSHMTRKININTATNAQLDRLELPGTGPSFSERIEQGRPYKKIEDLKTKKVISPAEYNLVKNLITVGN